MTTPASTDARLELVAALRAAGLTAYGYTPPTVIPPAVYVEPGDPWLTPTRIGNPSAYALELQLVAVVQLIDHELAIAQLEQLIADAIAAIPDGIRVAAVERPNVDDSGSQGETLTAALNLTATIKEG